MNQGSQILSCYDILHGWLGWQPSGVSSAILHNSDRDFFSMLPWKQCFSALLLLSQRFSYKGNRLGHLLQRFKDDIDRPLAAILTLNTIAHTVGAIGVGDQAAQIWAMPIPQSPARYPLR